MIVSRVQQFCMKAILVSSLILQTAVICEPINASVSLAVEGNGFHRSLQYQINVDNLIEECYVSIYLKLPSDLYVNVHELDNLRRLGVSTACSDGETDIEVFKERAETQNITICSLLTNKQCTMKLPIHQRYQYASNINKYVNITLPKPKLLIGCRKRITEYRVSKIDLCSPCVEFVPKWREISYVMYTKHEWTIPVGDTASLSAVTYITLLLTILCTIYLMRTIWRSMSRQHQKEE
nr:PREDICTED: phosphatidylinositol-glycan biosynthesis class X protein-like [Megachile rotundata]